MPVCTESVFLALDLEKDAFALKTTSPRLKVGWLGSLEKYCN